MHQWPDLYYAAAQHAGLLHADGTVQKISQGNGLYYGITWHNDLLYILARHAQAHHFDQGNYLEIYDSQYRLIQNLSIPVKDGHQILAYDGEIYMADSGRNKLVVYSIDNGKFRDVAWRATGKDVNHINSIWFDYETKTFYVVEHNRGTACPCNDAKQSNPNRTSTVVTFDSDFNKTGEIRDFGVASHNVVRLGTHVYSLSSMAIRVVKYDMHTEKKTSWSWPTKVWLRGMAVTNEYIVLGGSKVNDRHMRAKGTSYVYLCDRDFNLLDTRMLDDSGQICEIRALKGDIAHGLT